jgi:Ca-activated chloride channel family protein
MKRLAFLAVVAACGNRAPLPADPAPMVANTPEDRADTGTADLVLDVDLSDSMQETDIAPDRLTATRDALRAFVVGNTRDRIGIVIFGEQAHLHAPLTADGAALDSALGNLELGDVAGKGTAIGDAVALAVTELETSATCKIAVLLADGDYNVVNQYDPWRAAALAHDRGVVVHTVLVGTQPASVNPKTLEDIAATTDGNFYRVTDAESFGRVLDGVRATIRRTPGC